MAIHAESTRTTFWMTVMFRGIELREKMALAADGVHAHRGQLPAVGIVAVGASYSFEVHLALHE
jgi:hypothetical protein